jgi:carboxymethylenebutenolidase
MENQQNLVTLPVADGSSMACYTAFPQNKKNGLPAIILLQEAFGVNHHIRNVADKFAADGYVVIAPELFHRTAPVGFVVAYDDFPSAMPHYLAITTENLEDDMKACYKWLIEQDLVDNNKLFSVGYCLGGRVSFIANAVLPLKAAVSYYGGGIEQITDKAKDLHGRHLFFWGGLDQHIKTETIDTVINAVEAAGKEYINVKISYADHGFNCDEKPAYNKAAAKEALALTLAFLANS